MPQCSWKVISSLNFEKKKKYENIPLNKPYICFAKSIDCSLQEKKWSLKDNVAALPVLDRLDMPSKDYYIYYT